jgi:hypothetical protein
MQSMEASEKTRVTRREPTRPPLQAVGDGHLIEAMSHNKDGIARLELMLNTVFDRLTRA